MVKFISYKSESIGARYELVPEKLSPIYVQASTAASNSVSGMFADNVLCQNDNGLFMARSFCGSVEVNWHIVANGSHSLKHLNPIRRTQLCWSHSFLQFESNNTARCPRLRDAIELHYKCTAFSSATASALQNGDTNTLYHGNDKCPSPQFQIASRISVTHSLQQYCTVMEQHRDSWAWQSPKRERHIVVLWKLLHALWGQESCRMMV